MSSVLDEATRGVWGCFSHDRTTGVSSRHSKRHCDETFHVRPGERVSIFAQKLGMKLFAAKGPVEIQAQTDAMTLASEKDMTITSVNGKVTVAASKELILECGGAFVQLKDGNITLGGPGDLFFKVITIQKQGAASLNSNFTMPHGSGSLPEGRAGRFSD